MQVFAVGTPGARADAIVKAAAACRRGDLICLPTESVYALATDPFRLSGVAALRRIKGRPEGSAIPILVPSATTVAGLARLVPQPVRDLMEAFWPGQLTLLLASQPTLAWDMPASAPLTVRMPVHPVALELLRETGPLATLSANGLGMPGPTRMDEVAALFGDAFVIGLDAGTLGGDEVSTVVDCRGPAPVLVRRGAIDLAALRDVLPDIADLPESGDSAADPPGDAPSDNSP